MKHRSSLITTVLGLALYGSMALVSAAPASAASASPTSTRPWLGAGHHYCAAEAAPASASSASASSATHTTTTITCYATFAASIRVATSGRVRLPRSARPGTVTAAELNATAAGPTPDATTTYVLSIDFENADYGGVSLAWYQATKCGVFYAASMPSGWNDTVSSVIAYNGCATTLFKNSSFGTPSYAIAKNGSVATLGSFNDAASSETWCTAYPCGS